MLFDNDRWQVFLSANLGGEEDWLEQLRAEAIKFDVPIIRRECQYFLRWLLRTSCPKRLLEIGSATGYSALFMTSVMDSEDFSLTTIELDARRFEKAGENFKKYDKKGCITSLFGDAMDVLPGLTGDFDIVFLDAAKGQYINMLPLITDHMHKGSILVCDNVLVSEDTLRSRYALERRDRTIHKRMRAFLHEITADDIFVTDILPIGDGISVSTKSA